MKALRYSSLAEGISYLLLLFIAVPLKRLAGIPIAVSIVGMAHGILFIFLCFQILIHHLDKKITIKEGIQIIIASLIPFMAFYVDGKLKEREAELGEVEVEA